LNKSPFPPYKAPMLRIHLPILFLFFISISLKAQNLVPDPGFEIFNRLPQGGDNTIYCTKYWTNSTITAGDYYNKEGSGQGGVPLNIFGKEEPHSGNGYAGICIEPTLVEYIQAKLKSALVKGQQYQVTFYISRCDRRPAPVKEFGILFSDKVSNGYSRTGIPAKPPVEFIKEDGFKQSKGWMKMSTVYTAEGYESVLLLGHFTYAEPKGVKKKSHYYIDDVTIEPIIPKVVAPQVSAVNTIVPEYKAGEKLILDHLLFDLNSSTLKDSVVKELDDILAYLQMHPNTSLEISGHTDNTGDEKSNLLLSENRAKAVGNYFTRKGIDAKRLKISGKGSSVPIGSNDNEEGRMKNRRVEVLFIETPN
jgi:OOP family OmpA-OmpF porin